MIANALLAFCLSAFAVVPPAEPAADQAAPAVQRGAERLVLPVWGNDLGGLRQASLVRLAPMGDLLLVEDSKNGLTAVDPVTGQPRWFLQLPDSLSAWPSPGGDLLALACGHDVLVVRKATGSRVRTLRDPSVAAGSPVAEGSVVYVPSLLHDRLVATDLSTGRQAWEYGLPGPITTSAQLAGPDTLRSVIVGCADGTLRALPAGLPAPRRERWVARIGNVVDQPLVAGGRVLVSSQDRQVYALDAATGLVSWKHLPGELVRSAPVVAGDVVVFATTTRLVAVALETGKLAWEQTARSRPVAALGDALLCTVDGSGSEVRSVSTGKLLASDLPERLCIAGNVFVDSRNGTNLTAWEFGRR